MLSAFSPIGIKELEKGKKKKNQEAHVFQNSKATPGRSLFHPL